MKNRLHHAGEVNDSTVKPLFKIQGVLSRRIRRVTVPRHVDVANGNAFIDASPLPSCRWKTCRERAGNEHKSLTNLGVNTITKQRGSWHFGK